MNSIQKIVNIVLLTALFVPIETLWAKSRNSSSHSSSRNSSSHTPHPRTRAGHNQQRTQQRTPIYSPRTAQPHSSNNSNNSDWWWGYGLGSLNSHTPQHIHHYHNNDSQSQYQSKPVINLSTTQSIASRYSTYVLLGTGISIAYLMFKQHELQKNIIIINTVYTKLGKKIQSMQSKEDFKLYMNQHKEIKLRIHSLYKSFDQYKKLKWFWSANTDKAYIKIKKLYELLLTNKSLTHNEFIQLKQQFA